MVNLKLAVRRLYVPDRGLFVVPGKHEGLKKWPSVNHPTKTGGWNDWENQVVHQPDGQPLVFSLSQGNRTIEMSNSSLANGIGSGNPNIVEPIGPIDPELTVMRIDDLKGIRLEW